MAATISPSTGQAYGVGRVCEGFGVARSSAQARNGFRQRGRRGKAERSMNVPKGRDVSPRGAGAGGAESPKRRVLVVEDDTSITLGLRINLEAEVRKAR